MNVLQEVSKYHNDWLKIVKSFGSKEPEDIVQEMYLKIHCIDEHKVTKAYIWVTLRNIYFTHCKERKTIDLNENLIFEVEEHEQNIAYTKLVKNIKQEVETWQDYDKLLFRLYLNSEMSMRDIAKGTGISLRSIFATIKKCKEQIKETIGEDYQDYINKDYELI